MWIDIKSVSDGEVAQGLLGGVYYIAELVVPWNKGSKIETNILLNF